MAGDTVDELSHFSEDEMIHVSEGGELSADMFAPTEAKLAGLLAVADELNILFGTTVGDD